MLDAARMSGQSQTLVFLSSEAEQRRVVDYLNECSYPCQTARNVDEAIRSAADVAVAIIDIDDEAHAQLARGLRTYRPELALISLASNHQDDQVVEMLALGVEDHLVQPYDLRLLAWRVNAVHAARLGLRSTGTFDVRLEEGTRTVHYDGRSTRLTPSEFRLVSVLATRPGFIFDRKDVIRHVWGRESTNGDRAVDALVSRVRKRLERGVGLHAETIRTVRGVGYQFDRRQTSRGRGFSV